MSYEQDKIDTLLREFEVQCIPSSIPLNLQKDFIVLDFLSSIPLNLHKDFIVLDFQNRTSQAAMVNLLMMLIVIWQEYLNEKFVYAWVSE